MPNIKSAAKRLRQSTVRRARNRATKSEIKTHARRVVEAINAGQVEQAETVFRLAAKRLDQATSRGVIHKNAAARRKARLHKALRNAQKSNAS